MIKKILIFIIFFYILALIQTSLFVPFAILGKFPNLILVSVILFLIFENPRDNFGFFVAFLGGFFIDVFSSHPFGMAAVFLLFLAFILKKISSSLKKITPLWFSFSALLALILYNLFSEIVFYLLPPSTFQVNLEMLLSLELIYNFVLLLIIFYLFHYVRPSSLKTS